MSKNSSRRKQQFPEYFEESEENYGQINQSQPASNTDGKPIQLIRIKPTGKMQVDPQALQIIASIDKPIGFVSIVGRTHTGKSTLMNRLLHLSNKGFQVDKTNSGGTKGIWMWSQPYQNKTFDNCIIFLDTEGTNNLIKDVEHNTKIFTLSILLSSYFIYNSLGYIDQRTLSELELVATLPKNIQVSNQNQSPSENSQQLYRYMPKMLWVLRDFTLNIQDAKGKAITSNQYLQNCLSEVNTIGRPNQSTKKIKKSISTFFPNRDCLAMVRPVDDQQGMYHLNSLPDYALKKEFIGGINTLRNKIMSNTGPKTYEGKNITGYQMAFIIENYIEAFNSQKIPNIKTSWQKISEDEGAAAYAQAIQKYEQIFHKQFPNQEPKGDEIHRILFNLKQQTIKQFQKQNMNNKNGMFLNKLKEFIQEKQSLILEGNSNANEIKNVQILRKHSQGFRKKIQSNYYTNSNNKQQLKRDIEEIVKKYNKDAKGDKKGEIIAEFVSFLTPFVMSTTNTEADKQKMLDQIKLAEYQQRDRLREEQLKNSKKKLADIVSPVSNSKVGAKRLSKDTKREKESQGCCTGDKCQIM